MAEKHGVPSLLMRRLIAIPGSCMQHIHPAASGVETCRTSDPDRGIPPGPLIPAGRTHGYSNQNPHPHPAGDQ